MFLNCKENPSEKTMMENLEWVPIFFSTENCLQNNFLECCFRVAFEHWYISMLEMKFLVIENLENLACQKFSCWIVYDVSCWIIGRSYGGFYGHYYEIDGLMQNLNEDLNGLVLG